MDQAAAAKALDLYKRIETIQTWITIIQTPRNGRRWKAELHGRNGYGNFDTVLGPDIVKPLLTDEEIDQALTPLVLHKCRTLMQEHADRLVDIGFKKPDGCA